MADATIARIAEFARSTSFADIPSHVVHDCKRRYIDALGCGLAAYREVPCNIARRIALRVEEPNGAYVLGTRRKALPELAAFANGIMVRFLDGNDAYPGGGGHPSDMMSALLAVANVNRSSGKDLIAATTVAYEIYFNFRQAACMRDRGMDHVFYTAVGSAIGAGKLMGLGHEQMTNAISLAITPNVPLHATRRGHLSMWKGCAAGNAARNGTFAALLAAEGMTGPEEAIEGSHGLRELVGTFEYPPLPRAGRPFNLPEAQMKYFLSESHSHSPITAALDLHKQVDVADIESIAVYTYWFAWSEIGSEPAKWRPTTRETADHSLPYIVAAVLLDGRFGDEIFSDERLQDERIHALCDRITVTEDPELSRRFPEQYPCRIEVTTKGKRKITVRVEHPRGHPRNPMTDAEVNEKFQNLAGRVLQAHQVGDTLDWLWKLEDATDIGRLFELVTIDAHP